MSTLTHEHLDALEVELAAAFPGPWKMCVRHDSAVIANVLDEARSNADADTHRAYGGALVCESAWGQARAIIALRNNAEALIAAARAHLGPR